MTLYALILIVKMHQVVLFQIVNADSHRVIGKLFGKYVVKHFRHNQKLIFIFVFSNLGSVDIGVDEVEVTNCFYLPQTEHEDHVDFELNYALNM
jgi:hypothetical protein